MIYCVEDDESIRDIEIYTLRSTGFCAKGFADGTAFFAALGEELPELVLLDVMLPNMDGIEILRRLRASRETEEIPVIMATAKGAEYDKVAGLDLGADDYLVKPFGMMEMVSRIRAVLRRSGQREPKSLLTAERLCVNLREHTVEADGVSVALTKKEFEILALLMKNPGVVYSRDQLLSLVWGVDYAGETRTVDVHVRTLRAKLGDAAKLIETVRGFGYRLRGNHV